MKHKWEYKKLSQLVSFRYGYAFDSQLFNTVGDGMPLIRIRDVVPGFTKTYFSGSFSPEYIVTKGDYLIGMDGEFNIAQWNSENGLLNQRVCQIRNSNETILHLHYAYYFLKIELKRIEDITSFVTVKHLSAKVLNNISIPVPPMEVQKHIVVELDKINEIISDCKEAIRNLDSLAQSLFYDYFGDPVTNPKGWEVKPLKDAVIEMFLGPFGSALKTECYVPKEQSFAMVYEQKHAIKKTLEQENHFIDKEKFMSLRRFEVRPLDFIMSCRGTIGQLYQLPKDSPKGIIHPSVMKIRLNTTTYDHSYFHYMLPLIIKEQQTKGNCVQMAITATELGKKNLPVPPLPLQQKFAARIEQIEQQKKLLEQTIANMQTLLDSRMDFWFN